MESIAEPLLLRHCPYIFGFTISPRASSLYSLEAEYFINLFYLIHRQVTYIYLQITAFFFLCTTFDKQ